MIKIRSVEVVSTPVGAGQVVFERMSGGESLGRPLESSGKINVRASGDGVMMGSKVNQRSSPL